MEINTAGDIFDKLRGKYKNMVEDAIKDYFAIYQQNLIFMAEAEAGIYVKRNSLNGDSAWEIDGEELKQKLNKAEEDLKYVISVYEMINRDKNRIINNLSPFVGQGNVRIKSIVNGIETGEFTII